jgi:hypothetical protein
MVDICSYLMSRKKILFMHVIHIYFIDQEIYEHIGSSFFEHREPILFDFNVTIPNLASGT